MIDTKTRRLNSSNRRARAFLEGNGAKCSTKQKFNSVESALDALEQSPERGRYYHCHQCGGYHLGLPMSRPLSA